MIREDKVMGALFAINGVLVRARTMAYEGAPYEILAEILDYAEELPLLIIKRGDETERFEGRIQEICRKFGCAHVAQRLHAPESEIEKWRR